MSSTTAPSSFADDHGHDHDHHHDDVELNPATWRDGKRYAWLIGLLVPAFPFLAYGIAEATGSPIPWFLGPIVLYVLFPVIDTIVGVDPTNPPDSVLKWLDKDRYYRWCTYAFIPFQYAGLVLACWLWAYGDLGTVGNLGLMWTMGIVGGIAINTAHELGHKRPSLEKWLARVTLAQTGYGHFFIEHNRGHHVRVATPEDPASSRMGESFWAFLPRTVSGSFTSAIHLERERLDRLGKRFWTTDNDVLNAWAMTVVLFGGLTAIFGWTVLPYLLVQAVIGFSLLEVVNYLEHYGLVRQKRDDGRYERCRPEHSWNSNQVASNVLLYHLQRHSDHHANPLRRYQTLRHMDDAPQLPTGYAGMIVLAMGPAPLWRKVMDHRIVEHYGGDASLANIHPSKREKVLKRWARIREDLDLAPPEDPAGPAEAPSGRARADRDADRTDVAVERAAQPEAAEQGTATATIEPTAFECPNCAYVYREEEGAPREGFPAGTSWSDIPDGWNCPDCGVRDKVDFEPVG